MFTKLAPLPPDQRDLDDPGFDPELIRLLTSMLAAHDSSEPQLLDQTLHSLASHVLTPALADRQIPDYQGQMFGPWRALEELGRGGMAVVLKGERADGQFEKEVAIKLLPAADAEYERERLLEEIRILARLEHPNIAHLIDGGISSSGTPYLVMEYIDGQPITQYCNRQNLGLRERVELMLQMLDAIDYAHSHLVVHCDLKPGNILVSDQGRIKLVDFGIAGLVSVQADRAQAPRGLLCSPGYAAPEQLRGAPPAIAQDIFSLGAVLYLLLCGHSIRDNRSATRLLFTDQDSSDPITPPSQRSRRHRVGRDLDAICLKALANEPADRYRSTKEMAADLHAWLTFRPVAARKGGWRYQSMRWLRRNRVAASLTGLILLVACAGVAGIASSRVQLKQQAVELQALVDFQNSMLGTIVPDQVGRHLRDSLFGQLEQAGAVEPDPARILLDGVNFTDLTLTTLDHALFAPSLVTARERFQNQPVILAALLQTLAVSYRELGLVELAAPVIEEAVHLRWKHLGPGHPQTLASLREQVYLILDGAPADDADAFITEVIGLHLHHLGHDHVDTAQARSTRVPRLLLQRRFTEAEQLLREILPAYESSDTINAANRLALHSDLAIAVNGQGRHEEAAIMLREAITEAERALGAKHRVTLTMRNNLASTKARLGRLEEAESLFDSVYHHRADVLGQNHHLTLRALNNAASMARQRGDYARAEPMARKAYLGMAQAMGDTHPNTIMLHLNLANVLAHLDDTSVAKAKLELGLTQWRELELPLHRAMAEAKCHLGRIYWHRGESDQAEPLLRRCWETADELDLPELKRESARLLVEVYELLETDGAQTAQWRNRHLEWATGPIDKGE